MPVSAPEVLPGLRAPRATRLDDMQAAAELAKAPPAVPVDHAAGNVYVSKYRRYRVQITAPQPYSDPLTGHKQARRSIVAQFDEGVYRTSSEKDPETRAIIDQTLQSNPYFGPFGSAAHFWLASDQQARTEAARIASALNTLKTLPKDAVDQFVAALKPGKADDHVVTPIRPIQ